MKTPIYTLIAVSLLLVVPTSSAQEANRANLLDQLTQDFNYPVPGAVISDVVPKAAETRQVVKAIKTTASKAPAALSTAQVAPLKRKEDHPPATESAPVADLKSKGTPLKTKGTPLKTAARGKTPLETLKGHKGSSPSMGYLFIGVLLLGLMGVAFWLKRRMVKKSPWADTATIETLATHRVGPKHSVSLIRVPGRVLVVGIGDKGMTLLTELDESELSGGSGAVSGGELPQSPQSFVERLSRMSGASRQDNAAHTDPFQAALADDAPVDELVRLGEQAEIRQRLRALRNCAPATA